MELPKRLVGEGDEGRRKRLLKFLRSNLGGFITRRGLGNLAHRPGTR